MQRNNARHRRSNVTILITTFLLCTTLLCFRGTGNAAAPLKVTKSLSTGVARFVVPTDSRPMTIAAASATSGVAPLDILNTYGNLFGIADTQQQLVFKQSMADRQRNTHTTYQQVHDGVPVFAGLMRVHS